MEVSSVSGNRRKVCFSGALNTVHEFHRPSSFSSSDGTLPTTPSPTGAAPSSCSEDDARKKALDKNELDLSEYKSLRNRSSGRKKSSTRRPSISKTTVSTKNKVEAPSQSSGRKKVRDAFASPIVNGTPQESRITRRSRPSSDTTTCSSVSAAVAAWNAAGLQNDNNNININNPSVTSSSSNKPSPTRYGYQVTKKTTFRIKPVNASTLFGEDDDDTREGDDKSTGQQSSAGSTLGSHHQPARKLYDDDSSSDEENTENTSSSSSQDNELKISGHTQRTNNTNSTLSNRSSFAPSRGTSSSSRGMEAAPMVPPSPKRYPDYATAPAASDDDDMYDDLSVSMSVNTRNTAISDITMNDFREDRRPSRIQNYTRRNRTRGSGQLTNSSCGEEDMMATSFNGSALFDSDTLPTATKDLYQDSDDDEEEEELRSSPSKVSSKTPKQSTSDSHSLWGDETISSRLDDDEPVLVVAGRGGASSTASSCSSSVIRNLVAVMEEDEEDAIREDKPSPKKKTTHEIDGLSILNEQKIPSSKSTSRKSSKKSAEKTSKRRSRVRSLNSTSTEATAAETTVASYSSDGESSSVLEQKRALRAQRLEQAKERIRKEQEAKMRREQATKLSLATEQAEERARMMIAFQWYNRCGRPNKKDFQKRIKKMLRNSACSSCSSSSTSSSLISDGEQIITLADIDLMPWTADGSRVNRISSEDVCSVN